MVVNEMIDDRALAALTGLALGDALGMPTQSMSRPQIQRLHGPIHGLVDATHEQPYAPNMPAGSITDDTEQAVLVGQLLVEGRGHINPSTFAESLSKWERVMEARGSLDLLGPSTKAAIEAIRNGVPADQAGTGGTTNGAAMRVTPVGIACRPEPSKLLPLVVEASMVTHNTGLGLSSAAAVAMAVSSGLEGADVAEATAAAADLAEQAAHLGRWVEGGSISARIRWALEAVRPLGEGATIDFVADVIGTSVASQESVVAAFALASKFDDDPWTAICHAASIGGDTDTIAAIAGAMLGARHGMDAWPGDAVAQVTAVNDLSLEPLVHGLLALRKK